MQSTVKYAFVALGAIAKGRGRGIKSLSSLRVPKTTIPFSSPTDKYNQIAVASDIGKEQGLRDTCFFEDVENEEGSFHHNAHSTMFVAPGSHTMNRKPLVHGKKHMQADIPISHFTDQVMQSNQTVGTSDIGKEPGLRDTCFFEDTENEEGFFHQNAQSTMFVAQRLRTMNKKPLVHGKKHMQEDILVSPFTDQVIQSTQTVGTSALEKGRGQLRSMCSSEVSENEVGSFNQNAQYPSQSYER